MKRFERLVRSPIALLMTLLVAVPLAAGIASYVSSTVTGWAPTAAPTETPAPGGADESDEVPVFTPGGTALQNKAYFDYLNKQTIALVKPAAGANFIDALTVGGFDRAMMQVTPDTTAASLQADSIQFSVLVGDVCLIGQYGSGSEGYKSRILPVVPGIGCLIGKTRPIDW